MKILRLTDKAYEQYKTTVKGNQNISKDQARKKLTRNVLLADEIELDRKDRLLGKKRFRYGNMTIHLQFGYIVHIENVKGKFIRGWIKDFKKYDYLTKELGIVD